MPNERSDLIDRLYAETARHFRDVRVTEIQKMEDRRSGGSTKFAVADHAADAWDALDLTDLTPLAEWVKAHATGDCEVVNIPTERPVHLTEGDCSTTRPSTSARAVASTWSASLAAKRS